MEPQLRLAQLDVRDGALRGVDPDDRHHLAAAGDLARAGGRLERDHQLFALGALAALDPVARTLVQLEDDAREVRVLAHAHLHDVRRARIRRQQHQRRSEERERGAETGERISDGRLQSGAGTAAAYRQRSGRT